MSEHTQSVITNNPNAIPIRRDINQELAAISMQILDKEAERTDVNKRINTDLKKMKKLQRDLANQIRAGGKQLPISFEETDGDEGGDE